MPAVAGGLAVASLGFGLLAAARRSERIVMLRAGVAGSAWSRASRSPSGRPSSVLRTVGRLELPGVKVDRQRLESGLRSAGLEGSFTADDVAGAKLVSALLGSIVAFAVPGPSLLLAVPLAALGFRAPDFMLARSVSRRRAAIDRELPQLLDLLAAASRAGLSGPLALRRCADVVQGPLADEVRRVLDAVDLGGRWREEILHVAERLDLPDLRRAVTAFTRTETLGSSLGDAMNDLASRVRAARGAATTERARKAPVKMLFPLVFLVLPAFLLLTVVPVLFSTVQSIR